MKKNLKYLYNLAISWNDFAVLWPHLIETAEQSGTLTINSFTRTLCVLNNLDKVCYNNRHGMPLLNFVMHALMCRSFIVLQDSE